MLSNQQTTTTTNQDTNHKPHHMIKNQSVHGLAYALLNLFCYGFLTKICHRQDYKTRRLRRLWPEL
jgi:hypothetical protein